MRVQADPADRRVSVVGLTDRGQQRFDDAAPAHLANEEDLLRALSTEEQASLARLLRRLLLSFEGAPASQTPARAVGLRIGARSRPAPPETAQAHRPSAGVPVDHVDPGSPAAAAGLPPGDVIVDGGWPSRQVPPAAWTAPSPWPATPARSPSASGGERDTRSWPSPSPGSRLTSSNDEYHLRAQGS